MCLSGFQEQVSQSREDEGLEPAKGEEALLKEGTAGGIEKMRVTVTYVPFCLR